MKAILIDRDGVINKDPGGWTQYEYVTDWKDFHFLPGSIEALKLLARNGVRVIVISNQAGIGKGYFSRENLDDVTRRMVEEITKKGGKIEEVYYCIHKKEDMCDCRKPKTGMLESAARKHKINLRETYFIGDSIVDIAAGRSMGCKTVFVTSGKMTLDEVRKAGERPDYIFKNLLEAVEWILGKEKRRHDRAFKREHTPKKKKGEE